jgi:3-oxoacyl-[acyl-carrier protein] reductase
MQSEGKVAVVTGGGRGIGRAIAQRLAEAGALIAVHYGSNAEAATFTVREIEANGGNAFPLQAELSSMTQIKQFYRMLDAELTQRAGSQHFDILVNNAGVGTFATYDQTTEEEFDRLFAVNVKGTFFMTRLAIPRLRDGGRIINI